MNFELTQYILPPEYHNRSSNKPHNMQRQHPCGAEYFLRMLYTSCNRLIGIIHFDIKKFFPANHMCGKKKGFYFIENRDIQCAKNGKKYNHTHRGNNRSD